MNKLGNVGDAMSAAVVTYAATRYGWNAPFFITCGLCLIAAVLFLKIDATKGTFIIGAWVSPCGSIPKADWPGPRARTSTVR